MEKILKILEVIGVAGQKQLGKDTIADTLAPLLRRQAWVHYQDSSERIDAPWKRNSFAAPVKSMYCQYFGKNLAFIEEWKERKECPPGMKKSVREALTFIGEGFRNIQPDIWINMALNNPDAYYKTIFSDARYLNEAARIKSQNGFIILVYRPGKINDDPNQSEAQVRPFLEWCANTGKEGLINSWRNFNEISEYDESRGFKKDLACYDYFINNDGDLASLKAKVIVLAEYLKQDYDIGSNYQ